MAFSIKANTPEEYRDAIVEWLKRQASTHSVNGRLARSATVQKEERLKGETYLQAAEFVGNIKIERKA